MSKESESKIKLVRIGEVNSELLAKYCKIIKGYGTAADLAEKIGVNPSTISRIINEKPTRPISEDTIVKLANLIPTESGITKSQLYRANGMADPDEMKLFERTALIQEQKKTMERVILSEMHRRDNEVNGYVERQRLSYGDFYYAFPDFIVETDAVKDDDLPYNKNWAFEFISEPINLMGREYRYIEADMARKVMQKIGTYSVLSYQRDENYEFDYEYHNFPLKISIGFSSLKLYQDAVERFKDMKVPIDMSLIYVDIEGHRVAKEMPLRDLEGYRHSIYFDNNYTFFDDEENEISEKEWENFIEQEIEAYMAKKGEHKK